MEQSETNFLPPLPGNLRKVKKILPEIARATIAKKIMERKTHHRILNFFLLNETPCFKENPRLTDGDIAPVIKYY